MGVVMRAFPEKLRSEGVKVARKMKNQATKSLPIVGFPRQPFPTGCGRLKTRLAAVTVPLKNK